MVGNDAVRKTVFNGCQTYYSVRDGWRLAQYLGGKKLAKLKRNRRVPPQYDWWRKRKQQSRLNRLVLHTDGRQSETVIIL